MLKNEFEKKDAYYLFTISLAVILLISLLTLVLAQQLKIYDDEGNLNELWFWIISIVNQLSLFFCVFVYSKINKIDYLKATRIKAEINPMTLFFAVIVGVGIFITVNPIQLWILQALSKIGYTVNSSVPIGGGVTNIVLLIFVVVILPAFCEEQLFRGVITNGLQKTGLVGACLISGALFMLYHVNPAQTVHQFIMGVALAYIALKSGSIVPSMIVHMLNNLIVVIIATSTAEGAGDAFVLNYWYVFLFGGLIITLLGLYGFMQKTKQTKIEKQESAQTKQQDTLVLNTARNKRSTKKPVSEIMVLATGVAICLIFWISNLMSGLN